MKISRATFAFAVLLVVMGLGSPLRAQWPGVGVPIAAFAGNQYIPACVPDGQGGAFVAWADARPGTPGAYLQRIDKYGHALWAPGGIRLSDYCTNVESIRIINDGTGGAIIVWTDNSSGYAIVGQRINAHGEYLWWGDPVTIYWIDAPIGPHVSIAPWGEEGAFVAFSERMNGTDYNIRVQRIDGTGAPIGDARGLLVCGAAGDQVYPSIVSDGTGGAVVCWRDHRTGTPAVYAQRVAPEGFTEWDENGSLVKSGVSATEVPALVSDGAGGAIVGWSDNLLVPYVHAQRLDGNGVGQWGTGGVALGPITSWSEKGLALMPDGSGGAVAAWYAQHLAEMDIYAQRIDLDGTLLWGASGVAVCTAIHEQHSPLLATDGNAGAYILWKDWRSGTTNPYEHYLQHMSSSGSALLAANGIYVSGNAPSTGHFICPDGDGGAFAAWQAGASDNQDVSMQRIDRYGYLGNPCPYIATISDVPDDQGGSVNVTWDASSIDQSIETYSVYRWRQGASAECVGSVSASHLPPYSLAVPTLADSTAADPALHYFSVRASMSGGSIYWNSPPDSGCSVDNLPPVQPFNFSGKQSFDPIGLDLTWGHGKIMALDDGDFSHYALYRGASPDFVPAPGNCIYSGPDTTYFDGEWRWSSGYCYKLSAFDIHGNESPFGLIAPDDVTGADSPGAPRATSLAQNVPNPFNPSTRIEFALGSPCDVSLRIYDAAGRLVRVLVDGGRPAGRYAAVWDGRDTEGRAAASGIYFYRLDAGTFSRTKKMVLLR